MHPANGLHQQTGSRTVSSSLLTGLPGPNVRSGGGIRDVLVRVNQWYLKRGFLGFCFFNEHETHLVNLFSSTKSHLGGLLVQIPAAGKGVTVRSHPAEISG